MLPLACGSCPHCGIDVTLTTERVEANRQIIKWFAWCFECDKGVTAPTRVKVVRAWGEYLRQFEE